MRIDLFICKDDNNVVDKTLESVHHFHNAQLKDDFNVLGGSLIMPVEYSDYNYCFIPSFNRYYFMKNIILDGNRMMCDLSIDVLMTYKDEIKELECIIGRNRNIFNRYISDNETVSSTKKRIQNKTFPYEFTPNSNAILITIGG